MSDFGEAMAFWALTKIVRARLGVAEDDDRSQIQDKLAGTLVDLFKRRPTNQLVADRLARLLGLPSTGGEPPQPSSSPGAAMLRGPGPAPTVALLVEDLHDADEGLLDFLEHLVDWVRDLPSRHRLRPAGAGGAAAWPGHGPEP